MTLYGIILYYTKNKNGKEWKKNRGISQLLKLNLHNGIILFFIRRPTGPGWTGPHWTASKINYLAPICTYFAVNLFRPLTNRDDSHKIKS
jgi:hypothetical protein